MPLYRATRHLTIHEEVEVVADSGDEARTILEDDMGNFKVLSEFDGDYEVTNLYEVKTNEDLLKDKDNSFISNPPED